MTACSKRVGAALLALASSAAVASANADLTFDSFAITNTITQPTSITFEWSLQVVNIGDMPIDLFGGTGTADDVIIQTFLSDTPDASGTLQAAGGSNFGFPPLVLGPGEIAGLTLSSNTANLPDPGQLGNFQWLVLDILNTTEDPSKLDNNRLIVLVPTPGAASLATVAGLGLVRRRRA